MKKLIFVLAVASMALGTSSPASAADIPAKSPRVTYDSCGFPRFAGFYLGGNVGSLRYNANRNDLDGFLTDNAGWDATAISATAGIQAGYDWQSCNKVFGVVADWNWTNANADTLDNPSIPGEDNAIRSQMSWFGTLRARAGVTVNGTLLYVTGGVAAAKIKTTITDTDSFVFDKTRWGGVGGVGAEFALGDNWSLNSEVLYMQFAKQNVTFTNAVGTPFAFDLNDSAWVGRLGLNYRFGGPNAAAAYAAAGRIAANPCGPARFHGGYVGGNVGTNAYTANRNDLDGFLTDNAGWTATSVAPTAGIQTGYDWQSCNRVFGVVADWNWTNAKADTLDNPSIPGEDNAIRSQMSWFGTIRGRAGIAMNDALVYVTGGVAAAKIKTTITDTDSFVFDKTRWGVVGGAGAEFALVNNWSLNTEVLYIQFAKQNVTFTNAVGTPFAFDLNDSAWVGRLGLNYRWDNPHMAYAAAGKTVANSCGPARFHGGYVGGSVGGAAYSANRNDLDGFLTDNSGWTATGMSATVGVQAGYDWQSCNKVFGIVADLNWLNAKTTTLDNPNNPPPNNSIESQMRWFSTLRGRAGLAVNDTLVYVTGGVAAAKIETTIADPPTTFSTSKTRWGVVGGAGAEFALVNNWSLNTEVLYMQFAKQNATFTDTGGTPFSFDLNDSAWVGRFGLNYRWGAAGAT